MTDATFYNEKIRIVDDSGTDVTESAGHTVNVNVKAGTALVGKVGIDQVTANANEVVVKSALPAGANRIGTISGVIKTVSVTKILVGGAYSAEDVLSESITDGTKWTFAAIARAVGAGGYITRAHAICETTNLTPRLTLFLFKATPTSMLNDNVANTALLHADIANYIGRIDFPAMEDLGGDSEAICTPSTNGNLPLAFICAAADDALYGILVTRDNVTLGAGDDLTITLTVEQY